MKGILIIRIPFDNKIDKTQLEQQLSYIKDYISNDYYLLSFLDNSISTIEFKLFSPNTEIKGMNINDILNLMLQNVENGKIDLLNMSVEIFKEFLCEFKKLNYG